MSEKSLINHAEILTWGRYKGLSLTGSDPKTVLSLYRFMVRLRRCEQALIAEYHPADEMRCPTHFCLGQESVPAAVANLIQPADYLFSHHRSHGYFLAKGSPMRALFAELYGRSTGANGGIAGSQDISWSPARFYSGAILAGAIGISVGAALGIQLKREPHVVLAGFGEGATDEGLFWESISYASMRKLPVVFLCENNLYATHSHLLKRQPADNISQRVATFGLRTQAMFGNDVITVHRALEDAIRHARAGNGPSFLEAYTFRWNGHVGPENDDVLAYRTQTEMEFWKSNCPIALLEEQLLSQELLTPDSIASIAKEVDAEIADAFSFAKGSSFPGHVDFEKLNLSSSSPMADRYLAELEHRAFDQDQGLTVPAPY